MSLAQATRPGTPHKFITIRLSTYRVWSLVPHCNMSVEVHSAFAVINGLNVVACAFAEF